MEFCYNCDLGSAKFRCLQCPTKESAFCVECKDIHNRTKGCREHTYCEIAKKYTACKNCESSEAKFICKDCDETAKYLCLGCSVIHPKIKAFRGHTVIVYEQQAASTQHTEAPTNRVDTTSKAISMESMGDLLVQVVDVVYFDLSSRHMTDFVFWRTLVLCIGGSVSYYLSSRLIFRKYASLVNIGVAIGLYQWLQSAKFKVSEADKALAKAKPGAPPSTFGEMLGISKNKHAGLAASWKLGGDIDKEEFKDEFWYSTEGKKASLRPRVRPYKNKTAARSLNAPSKTASALHDE